MIQEISPSTDSIVYDIFETVDYRDCFLLSFEKDRFQTVDDFAKVYFDSQPSWLRIVSMNILSKVKNYNFQVGESVGSWQIFARDSNEIVFGEGMGFMDYRFSMRLVERGVEVSTVVKLNGVMGKYYFSLVKLFHKKFVSISLEHCVKRES